MLHIAQQQRGLRQPTPTSVDITIPDSTPAKQSRLSTDSQTFAAPLTPAPTRFTSGHPRPSSIVPIPLRLPIPSTFVRPPTPTNTISTSARQQGRFEEKPLSEPQRQRIELEKLAEENRLQCQQILKNSSLPRNPPIVSRGKDMDTLVRLHQEELREEAELAERMNRTSTASYSSTRIQSATAADSLNLTTPGART